MAYVIGIDAGASKTRSLALGRDGRELRTGEAAGANLLASAAASGQIQRALTAALDPAEPPAAVALCAAGSEDPAARERARSELVRALPGAADLLIAHDALAALYAASPQGIGVVLLSGTGSIAYGRDASGREARAGGWGYLFGDEGSAAWLGMAALRAAAKDADGRGPRTRLHARLLEELRVENLREVLPQAYGSPHPSPAVIAAAKVLARVAEHDKDDEAQHIIAEAADELARAAVAVARRLELDEIYLAGGAFSAFAPLEHSTRARLTSLLPEGRVARASAEPVRGAARLAAIAAWGMPV